MERVNRVEVKLGLKDDATVVSVSGELDLSNRGAIEECFGQIEVKVDTLVIVDLSGSPYLDGGAATEIIRCGRNVKSCGGRMAIVCVGTPKRVLVDMAKADQLFSVYPDLETAIRQIATIK